MNVKRSIDHAEARDIVKRLIAGSFRRDGERISNELCPKFSIPCRPDHDDDTLILHYIEQQEAEFARIVAERAAAIARTDELGHQLQCARSDLSMSQQQCRDQGRRITDLNIELGQIKLENARQRNALKPFADFSDPRGKVPTTMAITQGSHLAKSQLFMGDCYAAYAALHKEK